MAGAVLASQPSGERVPLALIGHIELAHGESLVRRCQDEIGADHGGAGVRCGDGDRRPEPLGGAGHHDHSVPEVHRAVNAPSTA